MTRAQPPLQFTVRPVPPFRLDLTVWALRRRPRNMVDRWDGVTYRRVVVLNGRAMELAVRQTGTPTAPRLDVTVTPAPRSETDKWQLRRLLDRLLGLRIDLSAWYHTANRDPRLRATRGSVSRCEAAEISDDLRGSGKRLRLPAIVIGSGSDHPQPARSSAAGLHLEPRRMSVTRFLRREEMIRMLPEELRAIGFSRQKARALLDLAGAITRQELNLESLARESDDVIGQQLLQLRGVGRWTAEYALLRGFGRLQVFPGDDVGAQKKLARWLGRSRPLDYAGVARAVAPWQPYAGLVYFHLLLDGLSLAGALEPDAPAGLQGSMLNGLLAQVLDFQALSLSVQP